MATAQTFYVWITQRERGVIFFLCADVDTQKRTHLKDVQSRQGSKAVSNFKETLGTSLEQSLMTVGLPTGHLAGIWKRLGQNFISG